MVETVDKLEDHWTMIRHRLVRRDRRRVVRYFRRHVVVLVVHHVEGEESLRHHYFRGKIRNRRILVLVGHLRRVGVRYRHRKSWRMEDKKDDDHRDHRLDKVTRRVGLAAKKRMGTVHQDQVGHTENWKEDHRRHRSWDRLVVHRSRRRLDICNLSQNHHHHSSLEVLGDGDDDLGVKRTKEDHHCYRQMVTIRRRMKVSHRTRMTMMAVHRQNLVDIRTLQKSIVNSNR